ncbi:MAG TPA: alkaline phosphatase D family protein [SAR86 cluster bacterium]|jgi:alkaline phosphatase D|nr:alkaline phosphatase D family protein [SAR86 cluster bacterium]HJM59343.1 alkaline phosphatase D family protein [SAR86 cluster bacterium]|tara:strand:- start:1103 stop:2116 length:1014 start_codon:yes stop_codon:yes gene_type:complete
MKVINIFALVAIIFSIFSNHSLADSKDFELYVMGFGSCLTEKREQPIWSAIKEENLKEFFFMGDNVYGDNKETGALDDMIVAYALQKEKLPKWLNNINVNAIWDDHDYGKNDGGKEYVYKTQSQTLFLDFWKVPENDPRRSRKGIYFSQVRDINNLKVNLIGLDTRYHRSALGQEDKPYSAVEDLSKTMLGKVQWDWLISELSKKSNLNIIVSSIQVIPTNHGFEKWGNFPHERDKLLKLIENSNTPTIIISGDRHKAGLYKKGNLIELTSSSLNKPLPNYISKIWDLISKETDAYLTGKMFYPENYGTVSFNKNGKILIELKDINGEAINSIELKL